SAAGIQDGVKSGRMGRDFLDFAESYVDGVIGMGDAGDELALDVCGRLNLDPGSRRCGPIRNAYRSGGVIAGLALAMPIRGGAKAGPKKGVVPKTLKPQSLST